MKKNLNVRKALKGLKKLEESEEVKHNSTKRSSSVSSESSTPDSSGEGDEERGSALDALDSLIELPEEQASKSKAKKKPIQGKKKDRKNSKEEESSNEDSTEEKSIDEALQGILEDGSEEGEEEDSAVEDSEEEGGKGKKSTTRCTKQAKRHGLQVQPPTHSGSVSPVSKPPAIAAEVLEQVEDDFDASYKKIPSSRRDQQRDIAGYLTKLQALVVRKAEALLKNTTLLVSPVELIKVLKELKDMELSTKWQRKLEKAILENPSKLLPPGQRGGWTLLSKVKEMSQQLKTAVDADGRKSGIKKGNEVARDANISLDLPEDPEKKVAGA